MNAAAAGTTSSEVREAGTTRSATGSDPLGERLRRLRVSAGMTQTELADGRFSKEYVSQIERGKTRPAAETLEWLAARLDVDPAYLLGGVSAEERGRVEGALARAEALAEQGEHATAALAFAECREEVAATAVADLEFRLLLGESLALAQSGGVQEALRQLSRAREISEGPAFSDLDRADVLFRMGVCRYNLSSISTAVALLSSALE